MSYEKHTRMIGTHDLSCVRKTGVLSFLIITDVLAFDADIRRISGG